MIINIVYSDIVSIETDKVHVGFDLVGFFFLLLYQILFLQQRDLFLQKKLVVFRAGLRNRDLCESDQGSDILGLDDLEECVELLSSLLSSWIVC